MKHLYNPQAETRPLVDQKNLVAFAKKNNWTSFELFAVWEAAIGRVNLRDVFDNVFLEKELNLISDRTSLHLSQFAGTMGSFGTHSMISQEESVVE